MPKLKNLSVEFLSLVASPATGKGLTLKSDKGQRAQTFSVIKADDEKMIAYGVVYAPDVEDSHGDTADAATIERAAHEFLREGRLKNIDREHSFTPQDAYVAESWILRGDDPILPGEKPGSWAVGIKVGDPEIWRQLKSGDLTGISLAGVAMVEPEPSPEGDRHHYTEKQDAPPSWFERLLKALAPQSPQTEEVEVKEDDLRKIVREELREALKSDDTAKPDAGGDAQPDGKPDAEKGKGDAPKGDAQGEAVSEDEVVQKATAAVLKGLEKSLPAMIAKATAKGDTETGDAPEVEESFA